jgi:hypothetical protein
MDATLNRWPPWRFAVAASICGARVACAKRSSVCGVTIRPWPRRRGRIRLSAGEEGAIGRPKSRARLLPTEHRKLVARNQQFDVLGELAATAPHEQRQQRREREMRERKEHQSVLPEFATALIENRNLGLEPLRRIPPSNTPHVHTGPRGAVVINVFGPPHNDWGVVETMEPAAAALARPDVASLAT